MNEILERNSYTKIGICYIRYKKSMIQIVDFIPIKLNNTYRRSTNSFFNKTTIYRYIPQLIHKTMILKSNKIKRNSLSNRFLTNNLED